MKHLCESCLQQYGEKVEGSQFPKWIALGSMLGAVAGLFMGPIVLIPASMIAGAAAYRIVCDICGSKDDVFEPVSERVDNKGITRYVRVPLKRGEQEPLDDQIWIDETKEMIFDETEGQFVDASDPDVDVSFDADGLDIGFDSGFDVGFGDGNEGAE